jgi:peptide/nickel transport system substrate-binding protein
MKRPGAILASLGLCLILACARRPPAPASQHALFRHLPGDPATLDPTTTSEEFGLRVEEMIFRPLLGLDAQRRIVPGLATSWSVSADGLTYEFRLDPEARWEDGSPVTSDDLRFTLERIRDPKVPAVELRGSFEDVVAIETPDPATARVRFRQPYAERLIAFTLPLVSAAAYARATSSSALDRKPVGTGPYRLESWQPNQKITLVRREDRPDRAAPFQRIVFRILPDPAVTFQAGARGDLDEFRVLRDQLRGARASRDFMARHRILKVPQPLEVLIIWNCRDPLLADSRVRRALALAWPREEAARRLYPPEGASLVSGPYPHGTPENDPAVKPPVHDPQTSVRLLEAAGLKVGPDGVRRRGSRRASFELLFQAGQPISNNLAEILRSAYAKVGVELVPRPLDWAAFSQRSEAGEFDAQLTARLFLPPNLDPYPYYHSTQWTPRGKNSGFYRNTAADRIMEETRVELDPARRLELYRRIHRLFAEDPPADYLWGADQYWAVSRRVEGVVVSPLGLFHFVPGPLAWHPRSSTGSRAALGGTGFVAQASAFPAASVELRPAPGALRLPGF